MRRWYLWYSIILTLLNAAVIPAQEANAPSGQQKDKPAALSGDTPFQSIFPQFRSRALVMDISARVVEQNQTVIWNESCQKTTMPGRPVGIKLVGTNLVVVAQFTPYMRGMQKFLVAQGQIWIEVPNQGMRYHTSMQTISLEFGEPVYFFPLGPRKEGDAACIEVMITLRPYEDN